MAVKRAMLQTVLQRGPQVGGAVFDVVQVLLLPLHLHELFFSIVFGQLDNAG
jgi:hypothetical protein